MANQITPNPSVPTQVVAEVKFPQVIQNLGIIPTSYKDSMSYYECLAWLCKYLEETVIPSVNQNGNAVQELQNLYIELNSYVTNYFDNLDVQEEINNKLDEMASTGVLQDLIHDYFVSVNQEISDLTDSVNQEINDQNVQIRTLNNRVDNIVALQDGSTTGDAELEDIRIAYNGITYASAGASVRAQASELNNKIKNLEIIEIADVSVSTNSYDVTINANNILQYGTELKIEVTNFSSSSAYVGYSLSNDDSTNNHNSPSQLLASNGTYTYTVPLWWITDNTKLTLKNTNTVNFLRYRVYIPFKNNFLANNLLNYKVNGTEGIKYYGYVNQNGKLVGTTSGNNRFIQYENVKVGDIFTFTGKYNGMAVVWGYESDGTPVSILPAGTYENQIIEIDNPDIIRIIGWSDVTLKDLEFRYYDFNDFYNKIKNALNVPNLIIVAPSGGQFDNIQTAINSAKATYDVDDEAVTIYIKNGVYEMTPSAQSYPYACINKGANKISLIGESKEGVIIRCTNTSTAQNKVMDIGGECIIENLTIECLNDGTYTDENDLGHICYCIHNDRSPNEAPSSIYKTVVRNCRLYSECNAPLGAGLQDKQIQIYDNVETISDSVITSQGSMYIHAPANASHENCSVIINNCTCEALDGKKALTLPDVPGSLPFTSIPTTIQRTICYSTGSSTIDSNFKTNHDLTPISALNNINDLNY